MYALGRGMGAVCANGITPSTLLEILNPLGCESRPGGPTASPLDFGSNVKAWWCAGTGWCSAEAEKASLAYLNPELAYPTPPMPPAVKPPADMLAPPASGEDARATISAILARQSADWKASNQQFFTKVATESDPAPDDAGFDWKILALVGVSGLALFSMVSGRGRN